MYESMTYDVIMERMLNRVPNTFDKREGSIIFDALAPAAAELAQLYIQCDVVLNQTFADTATHDYLGKRCAEHGVIRKPATYAVVRGEFTPTNISVIGQRFSCGEFNYVVTATLDAAGTYLLTCETSGTEPNGITGQLIPIEYISGLETATITSILIQGEDTEIDDSLRSRYYDSFNGLAYGGNRADYKQKVNSIAGVGGCKIIRCWNGGGTVGVVIIASDYKKPSVELIEQVQNIIDPPEHSGEGVGLAPIDHRVTIAGVEEKVIDVSMNITYQDGWNWSASSSYIEKAISDYFLELASDWASKDTLIVRISQIETRVLDCPGVIDIGNTFINGSEGNVIIEAYEIPVKGVITDGT